MALANHTHGYWGIRTVLATSSSIQRPDPLTPPAASGHRPTVERVRDALTAVVRSGSEVPQHIISDIDERLARAEPETIRQCRWSKTS